MELRRVAPSSATAGELRSFLAKFLFTGDDVYKHVRDLSGGEKGRLALAKLIYSSVNVLVLDEPTNHLDISSREALEEALSAYEGTIITISHDRYFLDKVATQMLALNGEGKAEHYDGDYTEYHDWKLRSAGATVPEVNDPLGATAVSPERPSAEEYVKLEEAPKQKGHAKKQPSEQKKPAVKVIKKKKTEMRTQAMVEADIAALEHDLNKISELMGAPDVARDATRLIVLNEEYQQTETRLRVLYEEWDRVSSELANASN